MLVLTRKQSQQIVIGRDIRITVVKLDRHQVRLGIDAPPEMPILRQELIGSSGEHSPDDTRSEWRRTRAN